MERTNTAFSKYKGYSGDKLLPIPTVIMLPGGSTLAFCKRNMPRLQKMKEQIIMIFLGYGEPGVLHDMIVINHSRK